MFSVKDDTKLNKKVVCISWNSQQASSPKQYKQPRQKPVKEITEEIKTETIEEN